MLEELTERWGSIRMTGTFDDDDRKNLRADRSGWTRWRQRNQIEDAGTIEDVYEPYLVKNGLINRTPKGREW